MAVSDFKVKAISERELLCWYRKNISPNLTSLEELVNGVDFCLAVDMLFPGVIGNRVIEVTKTTEYFKRLNFKRLQAAFNKLKVNTYIPIEVLLKGSFKGMFTFGMWFKAFFEANCKSQPDDLNTVRAAHLKKLVKIKNQHEWPKARSPPKDVKNPNPNPNPSARNKKSRNKGDYELSKTCSGNSVVSNTKLSEEATSVKPAKLISADENEPRNSAEKLTLSKSKDIEVESFTEANKYFDTSRLNNISQMTVANIVKKITGVIDDDRKTHDDKSTTESTGNEDCSTNSVTDDTSGTELTPSCLDGLQFKKILPPDNLSEQINIEPDNEAIDFKEELENLFKSTFYAAR